MKVHMKITLTAIDEHGGPLNPAIVAETTVPASHTGVAAYDVALKAAREYRRVFEEQTDVAARN